MGELVNLEVEGAVATLRLNRPPMNALNRQIEGELREAAEEAAERADVRSVVVYGGEKVFAAGADIKEMADMSYADMAEKETSGLSRAVAAVARIPKPTVAALTGYALGGGLELALACDRRVAADDVQVGQPEILLGVIPGAGGTQRLARLIGPSKAKDIIYTGRFVGADEALSLGVVDQLVPSGEVHSTAHAWAGQFGNGPARALAAAKQAVDGGLDVDLDNGLRLETQLFAGTFATEDQGIGMRSFLEHGPGKAEFRGR
ncbi:enoyl-CoA hydratase/isomerase family protein [Salinifilum ghardaiensis]